MNELLLLRFQLGARVRNAGAVYYRVIERAPLTDRVFWFYYETRGPDVYVKAQALGPVTVGGEANLFAIPYDADRRWRSGQYHAALPVARHPDTVALDLLDGAGHRLGRLSYRLGPVNGSGPHVSGPAAGAGWPGWGDGVGLRVDVRGSGELDPFRPVVPAPGSMRELAAC
ncbi:hypothetical protein [Rugosimonospora africana]|uniref:Uncharacterized protein n=1 Tax=Rugosimonospora africana TaxID=556532 RepID=A0A8J3QXH9_9ACTN|nr:hypothetical protein [Rugosimonospora africana]GIH17633.1 hypothetical protein Raf01_58050 [Rugosimonospora africana]